MIAGAPSRAFDVAVLVHACLALAALVVLVVLRAAAGAVRPSGEVAPGALRSFTGRRELAGRVVHLVPLSGLWALGASRGAESLADGYVLAGLALWLLAAISLEAVAFPAQRRCARALSDQRREAAVPEARRMAIGLSAATAAVLAAVVVMVVAQGA